MKAFARQYGLGEDRVRRELQRGFTGVLLKDKVHGGWIYPEYSALLAKARLPSDRSIRAREES